MSKQDTLKWFAFSLVLLEFATYASNDMILPAMPTIIDKFDGKLYHIPLSMSLYILGCACLQLFVAPLAEYYGQKRILQFGALYFAVTTLLTSSASSIFSFLSFRFIAGVSMTFASLGYSMIHSFYNDKDATKMTSLMTNFAVISPIAGPMLGVFILRGFSWHYIFFFTASLGILSFWGMNKSLPKLPKPRARISLNEAFKMYSQLLRIKKYLLGSFVILITALPYLIWIAVSTTVIKETLKLDDNTYILCQFLALGGMLLSTLAVHILAGRMKFSKLMMSSLAVVITGLSVIFINPNDIYVISFGMFFYGTGAGVFNSLTYRILGTIDFTNKNMIFTLLSFIQLIGFFIGITVIERLFNIMDYRVSTFAYSNIIFIFLILCVGIPFIYINRKREWQ